MSETCFAFVSVCFVFWIFIFRYYKSTILVGLEGFSYRNALFSTKGRDLLYQEVLFREKHFNFGFI